MDQGDVLDHRDAVLGGDRLDFLRHLVVALGQHDRGGHVRLVVFQRDGDVGRIGPGLGGCGRQLLMSAKARRSSSSMYPFAVLVGSAMLSCMAPDIHFPWPRTGHAEMDRQHDHLHGLIAQVYAGIRANNKSAIRTAIIAFAEAAAEHFAYESSLMIRTGFPDAHEHFSDHRAIAVGVIQLTEALDAGRNPHEVMDTTLTVWQAHHVGGMDQALAKHLLTTEDTEGFAS